MSRRNAAGRRPLAVIGICAFAAIGGAAWVLASTRMPAGDDPAFRRAEAAAPMDRVDGRNDRLAEQHDLAVLQHEVNSMKTELRRLRLDIDTQRASAPERAAATGRLGPDTEDASGEDARIVQALDHDRNEQAERLQAIEAALNAEPVDPSWSEQSGTLIQRALQQKSFADAEVGQVDCRTTLCRVELSVADSDDIEDLGLRFPLAVGASLPGMTLHRTENDDGSATAVIYLTREGHDFPS